MPRRKSTPSRARTLNNIPPSIRAELIPLLIIAKENYSKFHQGILPHLLSLNSRDPLRRAVEVPLIHMGEMLRQLEGLARPSLLGPPSTWPNLPRPGFPAPAALTVPLCEVWWDRFNNFMAEHGLGLPLRARAHPGTLSWGDAVRAAAEEWVRRTGNRFPSGHLAEILLLGARSRLVWPEPGLVIPQAASASRVDTPRAGVRVKPQGVRGARASGPAPTNPPISTPIDTLLNSYESNPSRLVVSTTSGEWRLDPLLPTEWTQWRR